MKTDPTSSISGNTGMPLAYEAIASGRNLSTNTNVKAKSKDAIADTLETTEREGDGRQAWEVSGPDSSAANEDPDDRLDLTG